MCLVTSFSVVGKPLSELMETESKAHSYNLAISENTLIVTSIGEERVLFYQMN